MHSVIEHLRSHSPTKAAFYRLVGRMPKGEYVLFPRDSHSVYGLGEAPRGLLPGLYQVFYFDATGQQIQHARVELNLTEAMASALGPLDGSSDSRHGTAEAALPGIHAQLSLPLTTGGSALGSGPADLVREQAMHKMAMESEQQKHSFVHNSQYAREIGEALMINRMMRQEMIELSRQSQQQVQDAYGDIDKQVAAMRLLRQARKEVMQDLEELPRQPAPKPDLLPLAHEAINTFGAIGMALVQSRPWAAAPQGVPTVPTATPPGPQSAATQRPDEKQRAVSPTAPRSATLASTERPVSAASRMDFSDLPERPESD